MEVNIGLPSRGRYGAQAKADKVCAVGSLHKEPTAHLHKHVRPRSALVRRIPAPRGSWQTSESVSTPANPLVGSGQHRRKSAAS